MKTTTHYLGVAALRARATLATALLSGALASCLVAGAAFARGNDHPALSAPAGSGNADVINAGRTAALLNDGRLLRWNDGGQPAPFWLEADGRKLSTAVALAPRTDHSATVLTDGRVLLAGGRYAAGADFAELWNPATGTHEAVAGYSPAALRRHTATLLADGSVLLRSADDMVLARFDAQTRRLSPIDRTQAAALTQEFTTHGLSGSLPSPGERSAPTDRPVALRFSPPLPSTALESGTITLFGPHGVEKTHATLAQDGRLLFITPARELLPAARYTVFADKLPGGDQHFEFTTAPITAALDQPGLAWGSESKPASRRPRGVDPATQLGLGKLASDDAEFWAPGADNSLNRWRTERPLPADIREETIVALSELNREAALRRGDLRTLAADEGEIRGRVVRVNDEPLASVKVSSGNRSTLTDEQGRFVLSGIEPGVREVLVDGRDVGRDGDSYGQFVVGVDVQAGSQTPVKPVYLPKVRQRDWIDLPSPLPDDLTLTSAYMPGFEVHLPKGSVLRDRDGKIVRRVALIPMPLDRSPIDFPADTPLHMSLQPAGLQLESADASAPRGMRLVYPNYGNAAAGAKATFINYDPSGKGWYAYGGGTVSADGLQVMPNAGAEVYSAHGFSISFGEAPPAKRTPSCSGSAQDGDPVDLRTGLFKHRTQGPQLDDVIPLNFRTHYRPDDTVVREFGVGTSHDMGLYLYMPPDPGQQTHAAWEKLVLVQGDCSTIDFNYASPSPDIFSPGYYATNTDVAGHFYGAKLYRTDGITNLTATMFTRDGTRYRFRIAGSLVDILDPSGRKLEFTRSGGRLLRVTTASGRYVDVTTVGRRITNLTDIGGRSWIYEYNTDETLKKITFPDGTFERYTYANGRMTEVWNRRGHRMVLNQYDGAGRVQTQTLADNSQFQFGYTTNGSGAVVETSVTRPNGSVRRVRFDSDGFVSEDTHALATPLQRTTLYDYDAKGFLHAKVDPLSRRTEFGYDTDMRLTSVTTLAGTAEALTRSFTYTADHDLATVTDEEQKVTSYTYDSKRRLSHINAPLDREYSVVYDLLGRISSITDERTSRTTSYEYALYDVRKITDPDNRVTLLFTDSSGRPRTFIDALGRRSDVHYLDATRTVDYVDAHGGVTREVYDPAGNLVSLTDPKLSTTSWTYDSLQRVLTRTDALLQSESWSYAPNRLSYTHTDRKQQTSTFATDLLGRPSSIHYADNSTQTFEFDLADRLLQTSDAGGPIDFSYNARDLLERETSGGSYVDYDYDEVGRPTSTHPSGVPATTFQYDDRKRLSTISRGSEVVTFGYDSLDRRNHVTLPNGVTTSATYGADNQLTALLYATSGTTLGDLTYQYDPTGQLTAIGGSFSPATLPAAYTAPGTTDAAHRLLSFNGLQTSYDANGNMTSDGVLSYLYDARDRLVEIRDGATVLSSFSYDALDRRTSRTQNGATTTYRFDGQNPVHETRSGQSPATVGILSGLGIDERYAIDDTDGRSYFIADHLGSTVGLTDSTGNLTTRYSYTPYGQTQQTTLQGNPSTNRYQYTGRENDGNGVYYYRARYYMPRMGRFSSEDPMEFYDGVNLHAYVGGSPLQYSDPLGLWSLGDPLPGALVDYATGLGDGVSGGGTELIRDLFDYGHSVDKCSPMYGAGEQGGVMLSLFVPAARATYAVRVSRLPSMNRSLAEISAMRNSLKEYYRTRTLHKFLQRWERFRDKSLVDLMSKYGNDESRIRAATGRMSLKWSLGLIGGGLAISGMKQASVGGNDCGCQ